MERLTGYPEIFTFSQALGIFRQWEIIYLGFPNKDYFNIFIRVFLESRTTFYRKPIQEK